MLRAARVSPASPCHLFLSSPVALFLVQLLHATSAVRRARLCLAGWLAGRAEGVRGSDTLRSRILLHSQPRSYYAGETEFSGRFRDGGQGREIRPAHGHLLK